MPIKREFSWGGNGIREVYTPPLVDLRTTTIDDNRRPSIREVFDALTDEDLPSDRGASILQQASPSDIRSVRRFLSESEVPVRNIGELADAFQNTFNRR